MADVDSPNRLINFPCKCGHRFSLTADMAAGVIQCPRCGLLNDVPTLSELDHIADDGTLLLEPSKKQAEPDRLAALNYIYNPSHLDDRGNEKDLRLSHEDLADVGADITPIDLKDQGRKAAPRYDPVTGELIREIEIGPEPTKFAGAQDPSAEKIPLAKTALTYAPARRSFASTALRIPVELFMPQNVIVLLFIFLIHILNQIAMFAMFGGFFFIVPAVIILCGLIAAHYGNTIEDTGPQEVDEVPRPIRGMSFGDDIWRPFCNVSIALMLCYSPALFILNNAQEREVALIGGGVLFVLGTCSFPAVVLTTGTSGTLNNLRPDRLLGLIRAAGWTYAAGALLWVASMAAYIFAMTGSVFFIVRMGSLPGAGGIAASRLSHGAIVYPSLMFAIFVTHWFCWHMGLIYRWHHAHFPWVLQRHISTRAKAEAERAAAVKAQRKRPSYVAPKVQNVTKTRMEDGR
jgi:hypothetical protein